MAEIHIEDEVVVEAPQEAVWAQIKDPARHAAWHPFVTEIHGDHELGATRACEVAIGKKRAQTRERCVAEAERSLIRWQIEQDSSGFLRLVSDWSAGFRLEPLSPTATRVTAESTFKPRNLLVRAMLPVVRRKFHETQRTILGALGEATENSASA